MRARVPRSSLNGEGDVVVVGSGSSGAAASRRLSELERGSGMDDQRFDALTRALAAGRSRRGALKLLGASLAAAVGAGRSLARVEAAGDGAAGHACASGDDCYSGVCRPAPFNSCAGVLVGGSCRAWNDCAGAGLEGGDTSCQGGVCCGIGGYDCSDSSECCANYTCVGGAIGCAPNSCLNACSGDGDCLCSGFSCQGGACAYGTTTTTSTTTAAPTSTTTTSTTTAAPTTTSTTTTAAPVCAEEFDACGVDGDCCAGMVCNAFIGCPGGACCARAACITDAPCTASSDCCDGWACRGGHCQAPSTTTTPAPTTSTTAGPTTSTTTTAGPTTSTSTTPDPGATGGEGESGGGETGGESTGGDASSGGGSTSLPNTGVGQAPGSNADELGALALFAAAAAVAAAKLRRGAAQEP
jgi:hypothetical protein